MTPEELLEEAWLSTLVSLEYEKTKEPDPYGDKRRMHEIQALCEMIAKRMGWKLKDTD